MFRDIFKDFSQTPKYFIAELANSSEIIKIVPQKLIFVDVLVIFLFNGGKNF